MSSEDLELHTICSRFETEWLASTDPPGLDDYLREVGDDSRSELFAMLLATDIEHRRKRSIQCDAAFYTERFPQFADVIVALFAYDQTVSLNAIGTESIDDTVRMSESGVGQELDPATRSFGDYELLRQLATGGMGVVFKARQISLNRIVALKMILAGQLATEKDVNRFRSEAEAAAKLDHPGIVPVFESGEVSGQHYYSMGFVEGNSLGYQLHDGPLTPGDAAALLADICDAVAYAHSKGIIHRDLKPGNVLLDANGSPRVTDFGLAKHVESDSELTKTGQILGTPSYMPPEQALGDLDAIGPQSDVYSLGAILYCLITGRPPFQAARAIDTVVQVLEQEPVAPRVQNPSIPKDLNTICLKCLEKDSAKRYDSAESLAEDLRRWISGEPIHARPITQAEKVWKWCRRNPRVAGLSTLAIGLFVFMTIGGIYLYRATDANRLVDALLKAETSEVPGILMDLSSYPVLRQDDLLSGLTDSPDGSDAKLHAALALRESNQDAVAYLREQLLNVSAEKFNIVRDLMADQKDALVEGYWEIAKSDADEQKRFRAACALAGYDPGNTHWENKAFVKLIVGQLAQQNQLLLRDCLVSLETVSDQLLPELQMLLANRELTESEQLAIANAIASFAQQDARLLSRSMLAASGPQYKILYEKYDLVADEQNHASLVSSVTRQPTDELDAESRVRLGKDRATSAITLLLQGERELVFDVLRHQGDPEALTQFIHRCHSRGVASETLIELLEVIDRKRGPLEGDRQKIDDSVMYALLLSLGEFAWDDLPSTRDALVDRLGEIYEHDPSSCVHSATGWLLRTWNRPEAVERVDQRLIAYDPTGHREWFIESVGYYTDGILGFFPKTEYLYLTFIVFQPSEFTMGAPSTELNQESDELQHSVTLTRPIAVCDREFTWALWDALAGPNKRQSFAKQFSKTHGDDDPAFGIKWFEAVYMCRALNRIAGVSENDQWYEDPAALPQVENGYPKNWPLRPDKVGFRLPTEAEFEYYCRSGTTTAFAFGSDIELIGQYAWYVKNSNDWTNPTAQLRPNLRGLYDIHGNVFEWCHDWWNDGELVDAIDPTGDESGSYRVKRGGSWSSAANGALMRSASRDWADPKKMVSNLGFRLVNVPALPEARVTPSELDDETE
ncbi:MAG: bifunctional serine/threonine-protein kinase/formylglycine-generating enzyme family protein [Planctomycetota bacterium]